MTQSFATRARPLLLVLAGIGLSACGNAPEISTNRELLRQTVTGWFSRGGSDAAAPTLEQNVAQALSAGSAPVLVARNEAGNDGVFLLIGENGDYDHFGNAQREVMTFRHGVITNTRGLGNDLMSSDIGDILSLVRNRRSGSAVRRMRHLDGENHTFTFNFDCTVSVGGQEVLNAGLYSATVTNVTEECRAPSRSFTNVYKVDGSGEVLASRQWVAPMHGSIAFSLVRR